MVYSSKGSVLSPSTFSRQIILKNVYHQRYTRFNPCYLVPVSSHTFGYSSGILQQRRFFSIPKLLGRAIKLPAYLGGGAAALGSYIGYKIDEATSYTQDRLSDLKDLADGIKDKFGSWLTVENKHNDTNNNNDNTDTIAAVSLLASLSDEEVSDESEGNNSNEEDEEDKTEDEIVNLTKQMIEIRSILSKVESSSANLTLPSIVVIGSQSSGKSSVLESIVGKEFLPKGSNMVTRRPIELTLVNTPSLSETTADFPSMRIYNLKNFEEVKRILVELNMAVPTSEAVSEEPIQLTIKSPTVPDLSLVDLPGYIQVEASDQPIELKSKIRKVCDKYLAEPNIILAISSADVDLANSSALRASKIVDPKGLRTIGVITKLDLVDPEKAREILNNKNYLLKMGYVGVVTKSPSIKPHRLFDQSKNKGIFGSRSSIKETGIHQTRQFESEYFKHHKEDFSDCEVTTKTLREKLIKILEVSMNNALEPTSKLIQKELDDTSYLFKVQFNDRQLTPKSYLLNNIDILKLAIKEFQENFHRNELKSILKADLDQRVLDLLASHYWKDDNFRELGYLSNEVSDESSALYWHKKLELASSSLTKIGVGRLSTTLITNAILKELENILEFTKLKNHDLIKELINNTAINVLNSKYYSTADQVENCIKPFKYEIDLEDRDWSIAKENSILLMKEELRQCNDQFQRIRGAIGGRKLQQVIQYLKQDPTQKETLGYSTILLEKGSEALLLQDRIDLLNFRLKLLKTKCNSTTEKDKCPEIFLNAVNDKLTSTAVLFLNVELLSDFFYNFPIELDNKLSELTDEQMEVFAKEDLHISKHIELQKRKELLELAIEKIDSILVFRKSYKSLSKK